MDDKLTADEIVVIKLGLRQLLGRDLNVSGALVYADDIVGPLATKLTKLAALAAPAKGGA